MIQEPRGVSNESDEEVPNCSAISQEDFVAPASRTPASRVNSLPGEGCRLGLGVSQSQPPEVVHYSLGIDSVSSCETTPTQAMDDASGSAGPFQTGVFSVGFGFSQSEALSHNCQELNEKQTVELNNELGRGITQTQDSTTMDQTREFSDTLVKSKSEAITLTPVPSSTGHSTIRSPVIEMNGSSISNGTAPQLAASLTSNCVCEQGESFVEDTGQERPSQILDTKGCIGDVDSNVPSADTDVGWVECRRSPVSSQVLAGLGNELKKASSSNSEDLGGNVPTSTSQAVDTASPEPVPRQLDPHHLEQKLIEANEQLRLKELEIEALRKAFSVTTQDTKRISEPHGARSTAIACDIGSLAQMTPLGVGLMNSRTPPTEPQLCSPSPGQGNTKRSELLYKNKISSGNAPAKRSSLKNSTFDFNSSSSESGGEKPSKKKSRGADAITVVATPVSAILKKNSEKSGKNPETKPRLLVNCDDQDTEDDDETPMKDIIRRRRKKEKLKVNVEKQKDAVSKSVLSGNGGSAYVNDSNISNTHLKAKQISSDNNVTLSVSKKLMSPRSGSKNVKESAQKMFPDDLTAIEEQEWNSQVDIPPLMPKNHESTYCARNHEPVSIGKSKHDTKNLSPENIYPKSIHAISGRLDLPRNLLDDLDDADIPISVFTSSFYNLDDSMAADERNDLLSVWKKIAFFKVIWKILAAGGWKYSKGKGLVDYYYVRPGRNIVCGFEERDYFTNHEQVLRYIIHYEKRVLDFFRQRKQQEAVLEEKNNEMAVHPITPEDNKGSFDVESLLNYLATLKWVDLWTLLMDTGWSWDYGSGLVNVWYFRPGITKSDKAAVIGVDKHCDEDSVRSYLISKISSKPLDDNTLDIIKGLKELFSPSIPEYNQNGSNQKDAQCVENMEISEIKSMGESREGTQKRFRESPKNSRSSKRKRLASKNCSKPMDSESLVVATSLTTKSADKNHAGVGASPQKKLYVGQHKEMMDQDEEGLTDGIKCRSIFISPKQTEVSEFNRKYLENEDAVSVLKTEVITSSYVEKMIRNKVLKSVKPFNNIFFIMTGMEDNIRYSKVKSCCLT